MSTVPNSSRTASNIAATSVFIRNIGTKRERDVAMAAQLIDHRLRFVFACDIIDAHRRAGVPESERDRAPDS